MATFSVAALLLASASATTLFATSYNDHSLNVLSLDGSSLSVVQKSYDCGSEPTWLSLSPYRVLYCLNEGWGGSASITTYEAATNGTIKTRETFPTLKSPVASTVISSNLAIAYYDTSSLKFFRNPGAYGFEDHYSLVERESFTYNLSQPGVVPDRQDVPHPHHLIQHYALQQHLFVPDLGADLIRMYLLGQGSGGTLTDVSTLAPVKAVPGSGPRHGAFAKFKGNNNFSYFYTVNELDNSITGYRFDYRLTRPNENVNLTQLFHQSIHGPGGSSPQGTKASEIIVSPDNNFLTVSSRGENSLTIPNFDPSNSTALPSDPLITYAIDPATGNLTLVQTAPAGGRNPRGFSFNGDGTLVASALQDDNRVVIIERDVKTGLLGKIVAHTTVGVGEGNGPNYVIFN